MENSDAAGFEAENQVTNGPGGRILTNCAVWSPDSHWIVYDTRSDAAGDRFDGVSIERVHCETGEVRRLYESRNGAHCGVATCDPHLDRVVFILGPEHPAPDWQYGPSHRQGVLVSAALPGVSVNLEARDLTPPLTPGALRGGTHVHVFSPDGEWVSFTYNDALLPSSALEAELCEPDQRNIGVSVPLGPVAVRSDHPRNQSGTYFSVLVTRTTARPRLGSDDIMQALEEGWVGVAGYVQHGGTRQHRALAFQGQVTDAQGEAFWEVFLVDLPEDVTVASLEGPLEGTLTQRPLPPLGTRQRRLTHTENRKYPGIQGPRHWLRSSPDGESIAFLMRDELGAAQIWTISPRGGEPHQITHDLWGVASAFTWNPNGQLIAYAADNSVFIVEAATGVSRRLTPRSSDADAPLPLACVFSPSGEKIAFMRRLPDTLERDSPRSNHICVVALRAYPDRH